MSPIGCVNSTVSGGAGCIISWDIDYSINDSCCVISESPFQETATWSKTPLIPQKAAPGALMISWVMLGVKYNRFGLEREEFAKEMHGSGNPWNRR